MNNGMTSIDESTLQVTKWTNSTVPYSTVGLSSKHRVLVARALRKLCSEIPNVKWVERTNEPDCVEFCCSPNSCKAYLGRQGGTQRLVFATWASRSTLVKQMLITMGYLAYDQFCALKFDTSGHMFFVTSPLDDCKSTTLVAQRPSVSMMEKLSMESIYGEPTEQYSLHDLSLTTLGIGNWCKAWGY